MGGRTDKSLSAFTHFQEIKSATGNADTTTSYSERPTLRALLATWGCSKAVQGPGPSDLPQAQGKSGTCGAHLAVTLAEAGQVCIRKVWPRWEAGRLKQPQP